MNYSQKIFFFCFLLFCPFLLAKRITERKKPHKTFEHSGKFYYENKTVDVYYNHSILQENSNITHLILPIHGSDRYGRAIFRKVDQLVTEYANDSYSSTFIIAPKFKTLDDSFNEKDEYYWSNHGWKQGNTANNDSKYGHKASSFEISDEIVTYLIGIFPNLERVSFVGHSAGGQYVQRYAMLSPLMESLPHLDFRFLVMNPSSYCYLNIFRPDPSIENAFFIPSILINTATRAQGILGGKKMSSCSGYNEYKYGLEDKNLYGEQTLNDQIIANYIKRKVFYFVGENDIHNDDSLDTSCYANLQGLNRLERGLNYFNFINYFYNHNHDISIISHVGHDSDNMLNSFEVRDVLLHNEQIEPQRLFISSIFLNGF